MIEAGGGELDRALQEACARARAASRGVTLDDQMFVRHLARLVARTHGNAARLSELSIEDLYLACGCLLQVPHAAATFEAVHGAAIRAAIGRVVHCRDDAADVEQQLLVTLLVGADGSPPLIGRYDGRAPLDRWLRVVAHRAAITWHRRSRSATRARGVAAGQPMVAGDTAPEVRFIKEHHGPDFARALKEGLGTLDDRAQLILRWHFVDGVTVERIGKMFGVTQPTATRWLAAARDALLMAVKARLRERLGGSTGELGSLAVLVASRLDLSLSLVLGHQPQFPSEIAHCWLDAAE